MKTLSVLLLFLCSCATYSLKSFEDVKKGMDKSDVLEILGSPLYKSERSNKHIWVYRFYEENKKILKEVQFEKGHVVYTGAQKTFRKIINPNGSSYSHEDLEEYLKEEKNKQAKPQVPKSDSYSIEQEMMKDLKQEKDHFKPIEPSN